MYFKSVLSVLSIVKNISLSYELGSNYKQMVLFFYDLYDDEFAKILALFLLLKDYGRDTLIECGDRSDQ